MQEDKMKKEIEIKQEQWDKIQKYLGEERFKDVNDFFFQAARLLLYSEEKKEEFKDRKMLKVVI